MKTIYFATTNPDKLKEAEEILGIKIKGFNSTVFEIQSLDFKVVVIDKAKKYYAKVRKPIFVEDSGIILTKLGKLPGTYTSDFMSQIGNKGLVKLIDSKRDALAITYVCYIDEKIIKVFEGKIGGRIAEKPRGRSGFGWDQIFIPKGSIKTFAEMDLKEKNKYSMRQIALTKMKLWLKKVKMI